MSWNMALNQNDLCLSTKAVMCTPNNRLCMYDVHLNTMQLSVKWSAFAYAAYTSACSVYSLPLSFALSMHQILQQWFSQAHRKFCCVCSHLRSYASALQEWHPDNQRHNKLWNVHTCGNAAYLLSVWMQPIDSVTKAQLRLPWGSIICINYVVYLMHCILIPRRDLQLLSTL